VGSDLPFADFAGATEVEARLLMFGSDGRKEGGPDEKNGDVKNGYLRGRFAADQCLMAAQLNSPISLPISMAPRFSTVPMRHFVSDAAVEFNFGAALTDFKTALNPRQSAYSAGADLKQSDGSGFPGGHHASGIFANAPIVLMANQISTSANVFTIHVVAQAVKDTGLPRPGVRNSGPGHSDSDDQIVAERWAKMVVAKLPASNEDDREPRFQILSCDFRSAPE
jgi:hypothetical protein